MNPQSEVDPAMQYARIILTSRGNHVLSPLIAWSLQGSYPRPNSTFVFVLGCAPNRSTLLWEEEDFLEHEEDLLEEEEEGLDCYPT